MMKYINKANKLYPYISAEEQRQMYQAQSVRDPLGFAVVKVSWGKRTASRKHSMQAGLENCLKGSERKETRISKAPVVYYFLILNKYSLL